MSAAEKDTMPPKYLGLLLYRSQQRAMCRGVLGYAE
jgi:hypothetical protein